MGQRAWNAHCTSRYWLIKLLGAGRLGHGGFLLLAPSSMPFAPCSYKSVFLKFVIFLLNNSKSFSI